MSKRKHWTGRARPARMMMVEEEGTVKRESGGNYAPEILRGMTARFGHGFPARNGCSIDAASQP